MPEVTLNLPGRDEKIQEYKQYLRNLGKAGIGYTTYAHMGNGIWTSGRTMVRGASAREFDENSPEARGNWAGKVFTGPLSHGREFTKKDSGKLQYFIKRWPGAERCQSQDRHTPGRPRCRAGGGPRASLATLGYKRAMAMRQSERRRLPGLLDVVEGGKSPRKDPGVIRYFARQRSEDLSATSRAAEPFVERSG